MAQPNLKAQWENEKRPHLKKQFQSIIYGYRPEKIDVNGELINEKFLKPLNATLEEHKMILSYQGNTIKTLNLMILKPAKSSKYGILFLNKCGNHTLINHSEVSTHTSPYPVCPQAQQQQGWREKYWNLNYPLKQGLTLITLQESQIAPDHRLYFKEDLKKLPLELLNSDAAPGMLSLWSWGLSHVMDYLETLDLPDKIGLFGHSRRGKAALLTAALDARFQFVIPHQSGTFGTALTRERPWESLGRITSSFPHWFTPGLKTLEPEKLPIDQDDLIALVAPRPILITEGIFDFWASPHLSLKALNKSLLTYRLYYPHLPDQLSSFTYWNSDKTKLTLAVAHAQLYHWHTMHEDYWKVITNFLQHKL